jgi:hypothetical protein
MMTDNLRAAAKAALETLDILSKLGNGDVDGNSKGNEIAQYARQNLRAALAEPAIKESLTVQRPWVGLTDEEISAVDWKSNETLHDFSRAIEAKLKDKNT